MSNTKHLTLENTLTALNAFEEEILDSFIILIPSIEEYPELASTHIFGTPHVIVYPVGNIRDDQYRIYLDKLESIIDGQVKKSGIVRIIQFYYCLEEEEFQFKLHQPTTNYLQTFFQSQLSKIAHVKMDHSAPIGFSPLIYKADSPIDYILIGINKKMFLTTDQQVDRVKWDQLRSELKQIFSFA